MTREGVDDDIWRCDCGGHHFVSITTFKMMVDEESYLSVMLYDHAGGLLDRLRVAWDILMHGKSCSGEVLLARPDAKQLHAAIQKVIGDGDA